MKLKEMTLDDFEEVVQMYYDFNVEVFGKIRAIGPKYFYYKCVIGWINSKKNVIIVKDKQGNICGFSMAYIDEFGGLTEPIYNGECIYVKPEYRKTRAGFMLYHNVVNYAKELGMNIMANGRVENGVDKMIEKHFKPTPMFNNYEKEN